MKVFEPIRIGKIEIRNRIAKSAMAEGLCSAAGKPSEQLAARYRKWADGGTGLIITGMAHVRKDHGLTGKEIGIYDDNLIPDLQKLTRDVHDGGAKIFLQICHAPPQIGRSSALRIGGNRGPSTRLSRITFLIDRSLSEDEIESIVYDLAEGARRAKEAGFDGVQFHAAHGYLISQFLSPHYNHRQDKWGGTPEKRAHFLLRIIEESRKKTGPDFPITTKISAEDGVKNGNRIEEMVAIGRLLEKAGTDAIEVSGGVGETGFGFAPSRGRIPRDLVREFLKKELPSLARPLLPLIGHVIRSQEKRVAFVPDYHFPHARTLAKHLSIPILCVGGIRSLESAEHILSSSAVAMISLARPLVCEPGLPERWKRGDTRPARCTSCNRCFVAVGLGEELRCVIN